MNPSIASIEGRDVPGTNSNLNRCITALNNRKLLIRANGSPVQTWKIKISLKALQYFVQK